MFKVGKRSYPIIVGGFYRSGTSLLRRILDSHSRIHCPPEIKFFKDFYGDYMNDLLSHVRFFSTARSLGLVERELLRIYGRAFIESHKLAAKKHGKKRWADKNPENLLVLNDWYELLDGRMFFIFIVRNPLDTIASLLEVEFPRTIPSDFHEKVDLLCNYVNKGLFFCKSHPEITFSLRYEDLVTRPREKLIELFNFVGERFEDAVLTDFVSESRGKGIEDPKIYNERDIHAKSINRWKRDLTEEQVKFILNRCANIIDELDYKELFEEKNFKKADEDTDDRDRK